MLLGSRALPLRRFENTEVARLRGELGGIQRAQCATIVPTYRRPDLLPRAVESALAQTFEDNVVVVVDDGGGLPELPSDDRLHAISLQRNTATLGLVRNVGIRVTDSTFIAFLDDDNVWKPHHLQTAISALRGEKGSNGSLSGACDLVYTAIERRMPDGTLYDVLSRPFDRKRFADGAWVDANAVVVRRDPGVLFSRLPRERKTLPKEDWEFVYRLSRSRLVMHVPEPTVVYLVNPSSYYRERPEEWGAQG
jgi:glycosyltransferase involved in cell wall biosynthesis